MPSNSPQNKTLSLIRPRPPLRPGDGKNAYLQESPKTPPPSSAFSKRAYPVWREHLSYQPDDYSWWRSPAENPVS